MSKNSLGNVLPITREKGLTEEFVKDFSEDEVFQLIFPDKFQIEHLYAIHDFDYVHSELKKKTGVNLKMLWNEYRNVCLRQYTLAMGYNTYCNKYSTFTMVSFW